MFENELDHARRRRLPGRVLRREGGHGHASRRPPAAPAPRGPRPAACGRSGRCWSSSPPRSATRSGSTPRPRCSRDRVARSRSTPGSPTRRSAAAGVRWQERDAGGARCPRHALRAAPKPPTAGGGRSRAEDSRLRLGTYRDLWAAEVAEHSPALRFLAPRQTLELAPADAERLGLAQGDEVEVRSNGTQRPGARRGPRAGAPGQRAS